MKTTLVALSTVALLALGCGSDETVSGAHAGAGGTAGQASGGQAGSAGQTGTGGQPGTGGQGGSIPPGVAFFVAPDGDDQNPGTEAEPFKTLERARDEVRPLTATMDGDVTVYLRDGIDQRTDTFVLTPADSGNHGHDVVWRSYPGERAILEGGVRLTGWQVHEGNVYTVAVPSQVTDFRQLYANGERQQRARSETTFTASTFLADGNGKHEAIVVPKSDLAGLTRLADAEVLYIGVRVTGHGVTNASGVEIKRPSWNSHRLPVDAVQGHNATQDKLIIGTDSTTKYASLSPLSHASQRGYADIAVLPGDPFYLENVPELLDSPGEFYLDRAESTLYWWPPSHIDAATADTWVPLVEVLLDLDGTPDTPVSNIRFEALAFRHSTYLLPQTEGATVSQSDAWFTGHEPDDWMSDKGVDHSYLAKALPPGLPAAAIEMDSVTEVRFSDVALAHLGSAGVLLHNDVSNVTFERCLLSDLSGSGMVAGHPEHEYTDEPMEALITDVTLRNSRIEHAGAEYYSSVGVGLFRGDGFVVEHSEIVDVPYCGISFGWGWSNHDDATNHRRNKVLNTYFERTMTTVYDGAPMYLLGPTADYGDPESERTHLIGNYSDNSTVEQHFPGFAKHPGVQLDDGSRNVVIDDNVLIGPTLWFQLSVWYSKQGDSDWVAGRGLSGENNYSNDANWAFGAGSTPGQPELTTLLNIEAVNEFDAQSPPQAVTAIRAAAGIDPNVSLPSLP